MAKRFIDTNKFRTLFFRHLPAAYKLLWDLMHCECDHAGVWIADFETAQIYIGKDLQIDRAQALELFNAGEVRVVELNGGQQWFLPGFIEMQYNGFQLNEKDRVHKSVMAILSKHGLLVGNTVVFENKPLTSPLQGAKDKVKEEVTDKVKWKDKERPHAEASNETAVDRWEQDAIEGNDSLLEAMEMKEKMETGVPWPPDFDRKYWILEHRLLAGRYGWKFKDQHAFRLSLFKVLRDGKTKTTSQAINGSKRNTNSAAIIEPKHFPTAL